MKLFSLFGNKDPQVPALNSIQTENKNVIEQSKEDAAPTNDTNRGKDNLIVITWGTGMPIDVIFNFIHKDFEEQGYQDALVNSDLKYRETKESIIRNDLKMLFKRISLRYQSDMRMIDIQIRNAQEAYALSSASMLQAQRQTYQEHLDEISEMEHLLDKEDPKMITMIESYRRGFLKGIAAQTIKFIHN